MGKFAIVLVGGGRFLMVVLWCLDVRLIIWENSLDIGVGNLAVELSILVGHRR